MHSHLERLDAAVFVVNGLMCQASNWDRELAKEPTWSRAAPRQWLDRPIEAVAAPFGLADERSPRLEASR